MTERGKNLLDENCNLYENFVKEGQIEIDLTPNLSPVKKKTLSIAKEKFTPEISLQTVNVISDSDLIINYENFPVLSGQKPNENNDASQIARKPAPSPKPSLSNYKLHNLKASTFNSASNLKPLNDMDKKIIYSRENTDVLMEIIDSKNPKELIISSITSQSTDPIVPEIDFIEDAIGISIEKGNIQTDYITYSVPMKPFNTPRLESLEKGIGYKNETNAIKKMNSENQNQINLNILPKLYDRDHYRPSSMNDKDIYSLPYDHADISLTKESTINYYNMSKTLHNVTPSKRIDHIYETVEESLRQPQPQLVTSLSIDSQLSNQGKMKAFFKPKSFKKLNLKNLKQKNSDVYEEITNPVFNKISLIEKFIETDLQYIGQLVKILAYKSDLVIHSEFSNKFEELFKIVVELKCHHTKIVETLRQKLTIYYNDEILIGDDLKEFALFDYKWNKEYLELYNDILHKLRKCDTEYEILRYFSINKNKFPDLLESLNRPIIQLQNTVSFFEELSNNLHQNDADRHEINQIVNISKEFLLEMPTFNDSCFFNSMPVRSSYLIERCKYEKKASYMVLFSDVIACQRLYAKKNKFSWIVPIASIAMHSLEKCDFSYESRHNDLRELQVLIAKSNLEDEQYRKLTVGKKSEGQHKKLEKLDTQILTQLSTFSLTLVDTSTNINHSMLLTSEYDRIMWVKEINNCKQLRSNNVCQDYNDDRLSGHVPSKSVVTILSESSEFIGGNLYIAINSMERVPAIGESVTEAISDYAELNLVADHHVVVEIDYYGYFLKFAETKKTMNFEWNESFSSDIEGASNMCIFVYKSDADEPIGHALIELSSLSCQNMDGMDLRLSNSCKLKISIKITPKKFMTRRTIPVVPGSIFGVQLSDIQDVNENGVPNFVVLCVTEIEVRGMGEPGLYRISGLSKKVQKIRELFDKNQYALGTALIKSEDINGVTSLLKLFFHCLPESLFLDAHYQFFVDGVTKRDKKLRIECLLTEFKKLPKKKKVPTATLR